MSDVIRMPSGVTPALPRGRLIFGVDATGSRAATWEIACELQARMLRDNASALSLQLVFYRGTECKASAWTSDANRLVASMRKIECLTGETQIAKILKHALREHEAGPVQGVVFVGDAFEEEIDPLSGLAGQLGAAGVPIFTFLEGNDSTARRAFRLLALRSGGRFFEFNAETPQAIDRLAEQLNGIARLAVGDTNVLAIAKKA